MRLAPTEIGFGDEITPNERRRLVDGFERAARELERSTAEREQALFPVRDVEIRYRGNRPSWRVRFRIDRYAYSRGFLACGFSQLLRSALSFLWPDQDPVHPRFLKALVHDDSRAAKPAQSCLARTLLELRRSAEFLVASDYFLKRTTDEHSIFREQVRKELDTWEPFGLSLLTQHMEGGEAVMDALKVLRARYEKGAPVDVFDLTVVVRGVCRTVLGVSAHRAEVKESVYSVANLVQALYRRVYGSAQSARHVRDRLQHAAMQYVACRARLDWFATQCYPLLLKMIGAFAEQRKAHTLRDRILGFLDLESKDILRPVRRGDGEPETDAEGKPPDRGVEYRTEISAYSGIASMLAHAFPGIGMEKILEGDYSAFPAFAERYMPPPEEGRRKSRKAPYEQLLSALSARDPLAPVIMLHRIVEVMLGCVIPDGMSRLVDPATGNFAEVRGSIEELRRQWVAVREELFTRYVQEIDHYARESHAARDPADIAAVVARRRAEELVNQIRNHIVWGYGYIEREVNRQQYFNSRPLYNLCDELFRLLNVLGAGRAELERGNPVAVHRLTSHPFLAYLDVPIASRVKAYVEAAGKVKPVLSDQAAEAHRVFLEFLLGTVDLLNHLLNDPKTPLRSAGNALLVAGEEERRFRERSQDGAAQVRDGLRRDFGGVDELTGLASKNEYLRTVPEIFRQMAAKQQELSFLLLDIDRFKVVNDAQGHDFGDRMLKGIAAAVQSALRAEDLAVRFGGEEILVVCRGSADEGAAQAERIRAACQAHIVGAFKEQLEEIAVLMGTREFRRRRARGDDGSTRLDELVRRWRGVPVGTVSVGVAQGLGAGVAHPCADEAELFRLADRMLYLAKDSGRNRVVVLSEALQMPLELAEYRELEAYLRGNPAGGARGFIAHRESAGRPLRFMEIDVRTNLDEGGKGT